MFKSNIGFQLEQAKIRKLENKGYSYSDYLDKSHMVNRKTGEKIKLTDIKNTKLQEVIFMNINDIPDKDKEEIIKNYVDDIWEEFLQIDRFQERITLKDIADVLQIENQ